MCAVWQPCKQQPCLARGATLPDANSPDGPALLRQAKGSPPTSPGRDRCPKRGSVQAARAMAAAATSRLYYSVYVINKSGSISYERVRPPSAREFWGAFRLWCTREACTARCWQRRSHASSGPRSRLGLFRCRAVGVSAARPRDDCKRPHPHGFYAPYGVQHGCPGKAVPRAAVPHALVRAPWRSPRLGGAVQVRCARFLPPPLTHRWPPRAPVVSERCAPAR